MWPSASLDGGQKRQLDGNCRGEADGQHIGGGRRQEARSGERGPSNTAIANVYVYAQFSSHDAAGLGRCAALLWL